MSWRRTTTYDGREGEFVLLGVFEETEDIVANDDTGLAGENVLDTHFVLFSSEMRLF